MPEVLFRALQEHPKVAHIDLLGCPFPVSSDGIPTWLHQSEKIKSVALLKNSTMHSFPIISQWIQGLPQLRYLHISLSRRVEPETECDSQFTTLKIGGHAHDIYSMDTLGTHLSGREIERLVLLRSSNAVFYPIPSFSQNLKILEVIQPDFIKDLRYEPTLRSSIKRALSWFCNLQQLTLHLPGDPICEVLLDFWDLNIGHKFTVLRLHDLDCSGLDRLYRYRKHGSIDHITCPQSLPQLPFLKLLRKLCPNVQELSLGLSYDGFTQQEYSIFERVFDSPSEEPTPAHLEELNQEPTKSITDTLASFPNLHHLTITHPPFRSIHHKHNALRLARQVWTPNLQTFIMRASEYHHDAPYTSFLRHSDRIEKTEKAELCVMRRFSLQPTPYSPNDLFVLDPASRAKGHLRFYDDMGLPPPSTERFLSTATY